MDAWRRNGDQALIKKGAVRKLNSTSGREINVRRANSGEVIEEQAAIEDTNTIDVDEKQGT